MPAGRRSRRRRSKRRSSSRKREGEVEASTGQARRTKTGCTHTASCIIWCDFAICKADKQREAAFKNAAAEEGGAAGRQEQAASTITAAGRGRVWVRQWGNGQRGGAGRRVPAIKGAKVQIVVTCEPHFYGRRLGNFCCCCCCCLRHEEFIVRTVNGQEQVQFGHGQTWPGPHRAAPPAPIQMCNRSTGGAAIFIAFTRIARPLKGYISQPPCATPLLQTPPLLGYIACRAEEKDESIDWLIDWSQRKQLVQEIIAMKKSEKAPYNIPRNMM